MNKMLKKIIFFFSAGILALLAACSKPMPRHAIDVFLEAPTRSSSFGLHQDIVMPVSGVKARITTPPVADIDSFTNAEFLIQEDMGEAIPGIRLQVKAEKWLQIYQASGEAIAEGRGLKRFFLVVDGNPVGYCLIRRQIRRDDLFFVIESRKDGRELAEELREVCFVLNEYILERREYMKDVKH
ncbi:hypothetical protein [Candidatus Spyradosoma sp. SGI.093]|uniref:hypothetical protein n=1 Tax=Candidatus Spyradosoma sp. SGI.093 TaxID=3420583 RepID=UPI003CFFE876